MITNKREALDTLQQEVECGLDDYFDESLADAELQRVMAFYSDILMGENEWNNMVELT